MEEENQVEEVVETVEEEAVETEEGKSAEEVEESAEEPKEEPKEEKPKKNRTSARQRIKQMRARQGELERELEQLRAEREKNAVPKAPKEDDFETYADFEKAAIDYKAEEKFKAKSEKEQEKLLELREQENRQKQAKDWGKKQKKSLEKHSDFHKVETEFVQELNDLDPQHAREIQENLFDSDLGAEIVYFLGKNPDELDKFLEMSSRTASRYIGKLEDRLAMKTVKKKTTVEPTKTINGGKKVTKFDPVKATQEEYNRYYNGLG